MASDGVGARLLDRVSCSICMEQFDSDIHVPKILPCQHTFCLNCLSAMSTYLVTIVCPVCRTKIKVPANGYTTNRAVLDVIEEIQKDDAFDKPTSSSNMLKHPAEVLKCPTHNSAECVLLCIDCLEGLCLKCIKQNSHHSHKLEELADAKSLLRPRFDNQIQNELHRLDALEAHFNISTFSVEEISQAEADMKTIFDQVEYTFAIWKGNQESILTRFKQEATDRENEMLAQRQKLSSLLEQNDIDIEELITKLKQPGDSGEQSRRLECLKGTQDYSFVQQSLNLLKNLESVFHCQDSVTSKFFKQALDVKPKDAQHSENASVGIDVDVDTSDIPPATCTKQNTHTHQLGAAKSQSVESVGSKENVIPASTHGVNRTAANATPVVKTATNVPSSKTKDNGAIDVKLAANKTEVNKSTVNATAKDKTTPNVTAKDKTTTNATAKDKTTTNATTNDKATSNSTTKDKTTTSVTTNEKAASNSTTKDTTTPNASTKDKTTADATTKDKTSPNGTTKDKTTPNATAKNNTAASATTGYSQPVDTKTRATTKESSKPANMAKHKPFHIDKIADRGGVNQTLIFLVSGEIIIYDLKSRSCALCPKMSPKRQATLQSLEQCKDVQFQRNGGYERAIEAVRRYYMSL